MTPSWLPSSVLCYKIYSSTKLSTSRLFVKCPYDTKNTLHVTIIKKTKTNPEIKLNELEQYKLKLCKSILIMN